MNFEKEFGTRITETKWGEIHKVSIEHPIGKNKLMDFVFNLNRKYSVGGSYHTVSPYSYDFNKSYISRTGASHRHIYDLSDLNQSYSIIPTGICGIPASDHYCDQTDMYIKGAYHDDYTDQEMVIKRAKYISTFKVK